MIVYAIQHIGSKYFYLSRESALPLPRLFGDRDDAEASLRETIKPEQFAIVAFELTLIEEPARVQ